MRVCRAVCGAPQLLNRVLQGLAPLVKGTAARNHDTRKVSVIQFLSLVSMNLSTRGDGAWVGGVAVWRIISSCSQNIPSSPGIV